MKSSTHYTGGYELKRSTRYIGGSELKTSTHYTGGVVILKRDITNIPWTGTNPIGKELKTSNHYAGARSTEEVTSQIFHGQQRTKVHACNSFLQCFFARRVLHERRKKKSKRNSIFQCCAALQGVCFMSAAKRIANVCVCKILEQVICSVCACKNLEAVIRGDAPPPPPTVEPGHPQRRMLFGDV